jgi:hypothetical protein
MRNQDTAKTLHAALAAAMQTEDKENKSERMYNAAEFLYGIAGYSDSDSVLLLLTICSFHQYDEMLDLLASHAEG